VSPDVDLYRASVHVIRRGQHDSGAYVASPTFPTYRYSWIQDGSFIAAAMDEVGEHDSAAAFHRWVAGVVVRRRPTIERLEQGPPAQLTDADVLHTRYTLEGEEGSERWANFQMHGYGLWLSALAGHLERTRGTAGELLPAMDLAARYLSVLWDRPCFDCWEEFPDRRHPATLAMVTGGLRRTAVLLDDAGPDDLAQRIVERMLARGTTRGSMAKFEDADVVDGSALLALGPLAAFPPGHPLVAATVDRVEAELVAEGGGVYRYLEDEYYGGGLWLPLSGSLAWIHAAFGRTDRARAIVRWMEDTADADGNLPEQVSRELLKPDRFQPWVERWGPVATPLLWSHAMYLLARAAAAA
jgi:GH15 family glucan-1,4-alpha-glucosidase